MAEAVDDFLRSVLRSGLLDRGQLQEALRSVPLERRDDPHNVANHLIQKGKLSRFQAYKLLQGATLGLQLGPYQIQTPIGRGGMGTVYLALDTRNQQHVAMKVLPPRLASAKEHYLARFLREMDMSTKVAHPNLAHTHEVGVYQGVYYIAMEYIPGFSLYRLVHNEGPLDVDRAARLFAEVAAGLEHAHGLNLIHRDLKPSNIMITPNDHAKILDLGLAVFEGEDSEPVEVIGGPGYVVGSLDYMAPEQTEDSLAVDARADIYALGCALYFAVCGQPPFAGGGKKEKVHAHRNLEPFPLHHRNPAVPTKFTVLVDRLMAKDPAKRPASAAEVRQELLAWSGAEPARPMEQQGDSTYQEAVRALETAPVPEEALDDSLPEVEMNFPTDVGQRGGMGLGWIIGLLGGFWISLLLILLVARMMR